MNAGLVILGIVGALAAIALITAVAYVLRLSSDAPTIWEGEIRRFEKQDRQSPPPEGVIVFTGSSSIRFWETLPVDMAPLPALNRGFGGAQIHQVTYYADRIVLPYRPRIIVFYAGENDMAGVFFSKRKTAEEVRDAYQAFCQTIHARLPATPIYFISIKPPKVRLDFWPAMQTANRLIQDWCASDSRLHYIDIVPAMLDAQGRPRRDVFRWDGIHLNQKGYALWTAVVKPVLAEAWRDKKP